MNSPRHTLTLAFSDRLVVITTYCWRAATTPCLDAALYSQAARNSLIVISHVKTPAFILLLIFMLFLLNIIIESTLIIKCLKEKLLNPPGYYCQQGNISDGASRRVFG
jgi:hypothetical protein